MKVELRGALLCVKPGEMLTSLAFRRVADLPALLPQGSEVCDGDWAYTVSGLQVDLAHPEALPVVQLEAWRMTSADAVFEHAESMRNSGWEITSAHGPRQRRSAS